MKKRTRKNITYQRSIIIGFAALYITCMLFSTYLVKENYVRSYNDYLVNKAISLRNSIYNSYFRKFDEKGNLSENYLQEVTRALSAGLNDGDKYNQISAALYGPDGSVLARTTEYFGETELVFTDEPNAHFYPDAMIVNSPYDYFTEEEIDRLLDYLVKAQTELDKEDGMIDSYEIISKHDQKTGAPLSFELSIAKTKQETITDDNGGEYKSYEIIGEHETIWEWTNPDIAVEEILADGSRYNGISGNMTHQFSFPYLSNGRKYYDEWKNNEFLQTFDSSQTMFDGKYHQPVSKKEGNNLSYVQNIDLVEKTQVSTHTNSIYISSWKTEYALQIKQSTKPWLAAIDYMKYVYLYGLLLMVACMIKTIHTTNKAYRKQEQLEQTRKDFTNAAAHELKTPLSIVRGLAETMEETTSEEKKSAYRTEIIHQTEVMDRLVKEMIFISKLDSKDLILKKEPMSILTIIEEQMDRLSPLIEDKNIQIQYWKDEDFILSGDKSFIEKAIFNLLENAVSHNRPDGKVLIHIEKGSCTIENTANLIPEEDLPHVFDMFFTSNKSRNKDENHKGLGLYLVKRIFDLHGLYINIENTDIGVKVTIHE